MFSFSHVAVPTERPSRAWSRPLPADAVLMVRDRKRPRSASQADEQAERVTTRLLARDAAYAAKVARVRRYQVRLRGQLSRRSWRIFLQLEEAEVERWTHALDRVVRWALVARKRRRRR
jgi:hypothetical protein